VPFQVVAPSLISWRIGRASKSTARMRAPSPACTAPGELTAVRVSSPAREVRCPDSVRADPCPVAAALPAYRHLVSA
jgi:hypothetical protein